MDRINPKENGSGKGFSRQVLRRMDRESKRYTGKELDKYLNGTKVITDEGSRVLGPYLKELADTLPIIKVEGAKIDHYRRLGIEWIRNINKKNKSDFQKSTVAITEYCADIVRIYKEHGKKKSGARSTGN